MPYKPIPRRVLIATELDLLAMLHVQVHYKISLIFLSSSYLNIDIFLLKIVMAVVAQGHKRVPINAMIVD